QGDEAADRLGLLGLPDGAEPALAEAAHEAVAPEGVGVRLPVAVVALERGAEGVVRPLVGVAEQRLDAGAEVRIAGAEFVEQRAAPLLREAVDGLEDLLQAAEAFSVHRRRSPPRRRRPACRP